MLSIFIRAKPKPSYTCRLPYTSLLSCLLSSALFSVSSVVDVKEQLARASSDKRSFQSDPTDMYLFPFFFSAPHLHFTAPHCTPHFAPLLTIHLVILSFPPPPHKRLGSVGPSTAPGTIEVPNTLSVLIFLCSLNFPRAGNFSPT